MANRVSDSEKQVLDVLWQESPLTSEEVVKRLEHLDWSERTVKTFLNRLIGKNAIRYEKEGRRYLYSPVVKQTEYLQEESIGFLEKTFKGDMKKLLATFVNGNKLSETELEYLRGLLQDGADELTQDRKDDESA